MKIVGSRLNGLPILQGCPPRLGTRVRALLSYIGCVVALQ